MSIVIYCADVGSIAGENFGWARADSSVSTNPEEGTDIGELATRVARDLGDGRRVALGFECPLFVPVPDDPKMLTKARPGELDRAWSAGAGCGSLATGLSESVWLLRKVRSLVEVMPPAFLRWEDFAIAPAGLFLWEAFVTSKAKDVTHQGDATLAVRLFQRLLPEPNVGNAIVCDGPVRSLIGAALLQTGHSRELALLDAPCLVLKVDARVAPAVA